MLYDASQMKLNLDKIPSNQQMMKLLYMKSINLYGGSYGTRLGELNEYFKITFCNIKFNYFSWRYVI